MNTIGCRAAASSHRKPRRLDASTGDAQGWDIAIRPYPSGGVQSGFMHADLIGRESTGGNRRAGAVFF